MPLAPARLAIPLTMLAALVGLAVLPARVAAAPVVTVTEQSVENNFPGGIEWTISFDSSIEEPVGALRYKFEPFGITSTAETECTADGCTAMLEYPPVYIPPFTNISYFWEIEDLREDVTENADPVVTDTEQFVYDDSRFEWQQITADPVLLHYYDGSEDDMRELLEASEGTVERWAELFGASIDFPVQVVVYRNLGDMRDALPIGTPAGEGGIFVCGQQSAADIVVVVYDGCGLSSADVLRHELTHLVIEEALRGPFGDIPLWLNEGAAVYSQESPGDYEAAVNAGIRSDDLLTINQLSSRQNDPDNVIEFYGQSWSIVSYLIETYGEEKFAELFALYKDGTTNDNAFQTVYGFDLLGLEDEWRESVGLEARDREPGNGGTQGTPESSESTAPAADDGGGSDALLAIIVGGATLGLVAALVILGVFLTRRMSKPAG